MEDKKKLDSSHYSVLENSQYLYPDNQNNNANNQYQKYQEELQKYEKNYNTNSNNNQINNRKNQQQHFQYSGLDENNNIHSSIRDDMSTYTFGSNKKKKESSSTRIEDNLEGSQNINQVALNLENSNVFNSSNLDLTSSIAIRKENNLITKNQYVAFTNDYGDNSCYVNVVLQLLFNIVDLNNIFKDLYKIDEMEKQNPKEFSNKYTNNGQNANENINANNSSNINDNNSNSNVINTDTKSNTPNENLAQSGTFKVPSINDLFIEIGEILSDYEIYLNPENTTQQVTILDTKKMRTSLEKLSNGLFPLNYVADPVELFIFILDNLNLNYHREIHSNFFLELIDKAVCLKRCPNSTKNIFDKDNFTYHIYVEELLNYIKDNAIKFKLSKGDLFHLSYSLYTDEKKECEKCSLLMDKFLLCFSNPKYLLINCVWKTQVPEIKEIVNFLFLLSIEEDLNRLFICQHTSRTTNTIYNLLGIILYSFTLCHYTVLIYNKKENVYALYNDDTVKEFKTLYDAFPELLINNVNLYDNEKAYFYPVMLIYTKDTIYKRSDIKNNELNERKYLELLNKIELNQVDFTKRHSLTEEQKKKNLEELYEKQRIYEQNLKNKNNTDKNNKINVDANKEENKININNNANNINANNINANNINANNINANNINANDNKNSNEINWMNYNFEDDKKYNQNKINNNTVTMTKNDYYKIYGDDLLKGKNQGMPEYKTYYEDLNNLNIDEIIKQNSQNNNYENDYLKNIHEQSNYNVNNSYNNNNNNRNSSKKNLESSQRINTNNNYFANDYDENDNNRLAQTQILPTTKYFTNINSSNNTSNRNVIYNNSKIVNNKNNNTNISNNASLVNNTNVNNKTQDLAQNDIKNQRKNVYKLSSSQQINVNNQDSLFNIEQNNINNQTNLTQSLYNIQFNNKRNIIQDNSTNVSNNVTPNLTRSQYIPNNTIKSSLNQTQNNIVNNNKSHVYQSQYNIDKNNNTKPSLYQSTNISGNINNSTNINQSQNNNRINVYTTPNSNRTNIYQSQNNTIFNNTRTNLSQSQYNVGSNYRTHIYSSQNNTGANTKNLSQSQYIIGNNNRSNVYQTQSNTGNNTTNRAKVYQSQNNSGNNTTNKTQIYQSQYNIGNSNRPNITQAQQSEPNNNLSQSHYNIRSNYRK